MWIESSSSASRGSITKTAGHGSKQFGRFQREKSAEEQQGAARQGIKNCSNRGRLSRQQQGWLQIGRQESKGGNQREKRRIEGVGELEKGWGLGVLACSRAAGRVFGSGGEAQGEELAGGSRGADPEQGLEMGEVRLWMGAASRRGFRLGGRRG